MAARRSSSDADRKLESGSGTVPVSSQSAGLHPAFYIALWIFLSSSVILFNKWVLASAKFDFPLFLTTWHMIFATAMTQIMARFTTTLDSRLKVPMNTNVYMRSIVPIGIMFSFSLICGNMAYIYLSVSFIQMLKATNAVATLLATWAFRIAPPNFRVLGNVSFIVVGIVIASFGEIKFDLTGFIYQVGGILFEALRLVMVQRLLSSAEFKMDPLVSLYYYAPACAVANGIFTLFIEIPRITMDDIYAVGMLTLLANAFVAFLLNVSVVLLIGQTSAVVLTMSGVLKDILLVVASMVIFRDPVTGQQFFGYSIALCGLVYYRLGSDKVHSLATDARLQVAQFRHKNPARALLKRTDLTTSIGVEKTLNMKLIVSHTLGESVGISLKLDDNQPEGDEGSIEHLVKTCCFDIPHAIPQAFLQKAEGRKILDEEMKSFGIAPYKPQSLSQNGPELSRDAALPNDHEELCSGLFLHINQASLHFLTAQRHYQVSHNLAEISKMFLDSENRPHLQTWSKAHEREGEFHEGMFSSHKSLIAA